MKHEFIQEIEELVSQLEAKISKIFDGDPSGHDIGHLWRTLNYAIEIQKHEKGDLKVIAVASFIHDVHRIMQVQNKKYVTPKESLPKIRELIAGLDLSEEQK